MYDVHGNLPALRGGAGRPRRRRPLPASAGPPTRRTCPSRWATHVGFRRLAGDIELINPGSVGIPLDGDHRAAYALLHDDGRVEHRRVAYDHEASAAKVRSYGGEWAEVVSLRIERARMEED